MHLATLPDIRAVPCDLVTPPMVQGDPAPGKRVRAVLPAYRDTEVHHALYLPVDWVPSSQGRAEAPYPVIVEYAGNGPYRNAHGDTCSGRVEDCNLGYGISGGRGFIWACLPYISVDHQHNQLQWWGDLEATVAYCLDVVPRICKAYGGDPSAVLLAGFSRGAIACNHVGLHNDPIAGLWRAFVVHSHYDGVRRWGYAGDDRRSAAHRLERLRGRAQFISHEGSVRDTREYLAQVGADGVFTFQALPFRNHTDTWVLRDIRERYALRQWVSNVLRTRPPTSRTQGPDPFGTA